MSREDYSAEELHWILHHVDTIRYCALGTDRPAPDPWAKQWLAERNIDPKPGADPFPADRNLN